MTREGSGPYNRSSSTCNWITYFCIIAVSEYPLANLFVTVLRESRNSIKYLHSGWWAKINLSNSTVTFYIDLRFSRPELNQWQSPHHLIEADYYWCDIWEFKSIVLGSSCIKPWHCGCFDFSILTAYFSEFWVLYPMWSSCCQVLQWATGTLKALKITRSSSGLHCNFRCVHPHQPEMPLQQINCIYTIVLSRPQLHIVEIQ